MTQMWLHKADSTYSRARPKNQEQFFHCPSGQLQLGILGILQDWLCLDCGCVFSQMFSTQLLLRGLRCWYGWAFSKFLVFWNNKSVSDKPAEMCRNPGIVTAHHREGRRASTHLVWLLVSLAELLAWISWLTLELWLHSWGETVQEFGEKKVTAVKSLSGPMPLQGVPKGPGLAFAVFLFVLARKVEAIFLVKIPPSHHLGNCNGKHGFWQNSSAFFWNKLNFHFFQNPYFIQLSTNCCLCQVYRQWPSELPDQNNKGDQAPHWPTPPPPQLCIFALEEHFDAKGRD